MTPAPFRSTGSANPTSERAWQRTLVELLEHLGWVGNHCYPLQTKHGYRTGTTATGWPDLVYLRRDRLVAIEVKGLRTATDAAQIVWLERFADLPCANAWILRPSDDFPTIGRWLLRPDDAPSRYGWGEYRSMISTPPTERVPNG